MPSVCGPANMHLCGIALLLVLLLRTFDLYLYQYDQTVEPSHSTSEGTFHMQDGTPARGAPPSVIWLQKFLGRNAAHIIVTALLLYNYEEATSPGLFVSHVDGASLSGQVIGRQAKGKEGGSHFSKRLFKECVSALPPWRDQPSTSDDDGFYIWSCAKQSKSKVGLQHNSVVIITDGKMKVLAHKVIEGYRTWAPKMINATALLLLATKGDTAQIYKRPASRGIIWNIVTGALRYVAMGTCTHDLDYDERTDTWMALMARKAQFICDPAHPVFRLAKCSAGRNFSVDYDMVQEQDSDGRVLWRWNPIDFLTTWTLQHGPLSITRDAVTATDNRTVFTDLTHLNGIFWDHATGLVYANSRNLDTVFAIERGTGTLRWSCGRFGTLPSFRGQSQVVSHFSRSHLFYAAGNNRFYTFDNDLLELVGGQYRYRTPYNSKVRLLRREGDSMREVAHVTSKRRVIGGGLTLLPRGRFLALFGDGTQQMVVEGDWKGHIHRTGAVQGHSMFMYYPGKVFDRPLLDVSLVRNGSRPQRAARVCIWDSYLRRYPGAGVLTIISKDAACDRLCHENRGYEYSWDVVLEAHWQESCHVIVVPYGSFAVKLQNGEGLTRLVHQPRPCICPLPNQPSAVGKGG
uniref:Uncharacterized protein n=1 Tax=Eutreptiella gymnastica TaxID=73025 RepID=A0A7S1N6Q0_9EUGL|mmetsp:Transcript_125916/g.218219  ORF Transcript_125916/g.218219 Transcript_125916/m.218219 type:complete len:630 (+) Transcript_125916:110-1999(+)